MTNEPMTNDHLTIRLPDHLTTAFDSSPTLCYPIVGMKPIQRS